MNYLNQIDSGYRSELKELNELNFSRFDAKLEQRVGYLDAKLEQRLAELKAELIKWMFAFWAPTGLAVIGTAVAVIALLLKG